MAARLDVARRLADEYAADPAVLGVLCAGSTGRGDADRWSDLELLTVWSTSPDDGQRRRVADAVGASAVRLFAYEPAEFGSADDFWLGEPGLGLLVEVGHATAADATAALDRCWSTRNQILYLLTVASAYASGRRMCGDLSAWRDRVRSYPPDLAAAVIRRHGQIDNFWRWQMYVERGNPHGLRTHFAGVAEAVSHISCALSGRFWPGGKWPTRTLDGLPVAPVDLAERLAAVDTMPPVAAANALADLVDEAYDLVELRHPAVDVDRLREIFHFGRSPVAVGRRAIT